MDCKKLDKKNMRIVPLRPTTINNNFPFLDETFDEMTEWGQIQKIQEKLNECINIINNVIDEKINDYIDKRFNDIMLDAMYIQETETLVMYLARAESEE